MRDFAATQEDAVVDGDVAIVDPEVDVCAAAMVPARKESLEADDTVLVCGLDTAQPDRILDGLSAFVERGLGVQVLFGPAGVDAHGIGVPDIDVNIWDRFTCFDIKNSNVEA